LARRHGRHQREDDLRTGRLTRVLPDYVQHAGSISAIFANRRNLAPKIRVFIDFLAESFAGRQAPSRKKAPADRRERIATETG